LNRNKSDRRDFSRDTDIDAKSFTLPDIVIPAAFVVLRCHCRTVKHRYWLAICLFNDIFAELDSINGASMSDHPQFIGDLGIVIP
jgi:hypothetical protein